jgi:hypothetical protein
VRGVGDTRERRQNSDCLLFASSFYFPRAASFASSYCFRFVIVYYSSMYNSHFSVPLKMCSDTELGLIL